MLDTPALCASCQVIGGHEATELLASGHLPVYTAEAWGVLVGVPVSPLVFRAGHQARASYAIGAALAITEQMHSGH